MTVRLLARHSLLVGLVAGLASVGGSGCADDKTKSSLDPEGPPEVRQVFINDPNSTDDPLSAYALAYGIHPNAWRCTVVDNECPSAELRCEDSGDLGGHGVFASGDNAGQMPGSTSAVASNH